jgi:hypothetical protein
MTIIVAYCVSRQAWQNPGSGCMTVVCAMDNGTYEVEAHHPSMQPFYDTRYKDATTMAPHEFFAAHPKAPRV